MSEVKAKGLLTGIIIAVLALPIGYVVFEIIEIVIHFLWVDLAADLPTGVRWPFIVLLPAIAGALVAWIRIRWEDGHNPLGGLAMSEVRFRQYPSLLGAVVVSLFGGLVLGPEVALVVTGGLIGTEVSLRRGDLDVKKGMLIGVAAAVLALFAGPMLQGTFNVSPNYQFRWQDLVGAVGIAATTAGVLALGRYLALLLTRIRHGDRPIVWQTTLIGFVIGVIALIYHVTTGQDVALIMNSGEKQVLPLLELGSVSAILLAVAVKWILYAFSMGGGFRGGPYFPAIFVGAGIGGIFTLVVPDLSKAGAAAGLIAAVFYLAHAKLLPTIIGAGVVGFLLIGWTVVPLAIVAALVARLLPEMKLHTQPTGAMDEELVK